MNCESGAEDPNPSAKLAVRFAAPNFNINNSKES
jgi:hypothetical protein